MGTNKSLDVQLLLLLISLVLLSEGQQFCTENDRRVYDVTIVNGDNKRRMNASTTDVEQCISVVNHIQQCIDQSRSQTTRRSDEYSKNNFVEAGGFYCTTECFEDGMRIDYTVFSRNYSITTAAGEMEQIFSQRCADCCNNVRMVSVTYTDSDENKVRFILDIEPGRLCFTKSIQSPVKQ